VLLRTLRLDSDTIIGAKFRGILSWIRMKEWKYSRFDVVEFHISGSTHLSRLSVASCPSVVSQRQTSILYLDSFRLHSGLPHLQGLSTLNDKLRPMANSFAGEGSCLEQSQKMGGLKVQLKDRKTRCSIGHFAR
jgi:hypothetical protein